VSLIGSLEQFDLANILRRLEVFSKTGLLVVKQGDIWVEFYFRQGQLVCIGPMRANTTLIDRLLQANLLSQQSLPQVRALIDPSESNETRIALALINGGYLSREILRAWASHETSQILRAIFSWPTGEIYFEEEHPTPPDRLLVALSVSTLLDTLPAPAAPLPANAGASSPNGPLYTQETPVRSASGASAQAAPGPGGLLHASQLLEPASLPVAASSTEGGAGLLSASELIEDLPFNLASASRTGQPVETPPSFASAAPAKVSLGAELDISSSTQVSFLPPQPVPNPLPPARIDTSFMTPDLVLVPVDLSSLRERNPQVQLTPDQWRLFALIDGQTSLQMLCQALMASADQVRAIAGELLAIGLVMPQPTGSVSAMPVPPIMVPDSAATPAGQYASVPPSWPSQPLSPPPFVQPIATQSQWGNGNNGATFVVGGGWIVSSPQVAPQPAYAQPGLAYAPMGGYR
jgi:hypothetical protein